MAVPRGAVSIEFMVIDILSSPMLLYPGLYLYKGWLLILVGYVYQYMLDPGSGVIGDPRAVHYQYSYSHGIETYTHWAVITGIHG